VDYIIVEMLSVTALVQTYFASDDDYREFQNYLMSAPRRGNVVPGCAGVRKIRWREARRGKGGRGGLRISYLFLPAHRRIVLLDVFSKREKSDHSAEDIRLLRKSVQDYLASLPATKKEQPP